YTRPMSCTSPPLLLPGSSHCFNTWSIDSGNCQSKQPGRSRKPQSGKDLSPRESPRCAEGSFSVLSLKLSVQDRKTGTSLLAKVARAKWRAEILRLAAPARDSHPRHWRSLRMKMGRSQRSLVLNTKDLEHMQLGSIYGRL